MANKGYTTASAVGNYLARTLTTAQTQQADTLIGVAETYIDRETRRLSAAGYGGWNMAPIPNERYDLSEPVLRLRFAPVTSVESIQTRTTQVGDTPVTLTAGIDYELLDASRGEVRFVSGWHGRHSIALVSYTPNRPVPTDITFAATLIVAHSLQMTLFADRWGMEDVKVDNDTAVTYTDGGMTIHVPETARAIIAAYRLPLIV